MQYSWKYKRAKRPSLLDMIRLVVVFYLDSVFFLLCVSVVWGQVPGGGEWGAAVEKASCCGRLPGQSQEGWAVRFMYLFIFNQICLNWEKQKSTLQLPESFRVKQVDWISFLFPPPTPELCGNTAVFAKSMAMLGNSEDNTALSRALSQLAEVEDKMEQLHQEQAASDFFIFAELLADYIRLLGAVRVSWQLQNG